MKAASLSTICFSLTHKLGTTDLGRFDIFVPADFPNSPPSVVLKTTGGGKVRFNPNTYADGKGTYSILGVWP